MSAPLVCSFSCVNFFLTVLLFWKVRKKKIGKKKSLSVRREMSEWNNRIDGVRIWQERVSESCLPVRLLSASFSSSVLLLTSTKQSYCDFYGKNNNRVLPRWTEIGLHSEIRDDATASNKQRNKQQAESSSYDRSWSNDMMKKKKHENEEKKAESFFVFRLYIRMTFRRARTFTTPKRRRLHKHMYWCAHDDQVTLFKRSIFCISFLRMDHGKRTIMIFFIWFFSIYFWIFQVFFKQKTNQKIII